MLFIQRNPLFWTGIVLVGLILFVFLNSDRSNLTESQDLPIPQTLETSSNNNIDRDLLIPAGMRARQVIESAREIGKPYPHDDFFEKAKNYQAEGSLADAHLLYFFNARAGHLESMMAIAMMSDPTQFHIENSLLDQPDAIQAYKWYQKLILAGYEPANERMQALKQWAIDEAEFGNPYAHQLLLNLE